MRFHPGVNCGISEVASAQGGVVFHDLRGINAPGNQCCDMREWDARALEDGYTAEDAGVGNDPPAASVIGRQIMSEMTA